ncbi:extracellular tyrosine-protein kinase PKDCC-like [Pseudophryne corroboree]|uniref:extracellular tyrosine-protein kinase PKDCC-like n=1 Tax=Pseudophryne corroboree TaxID=495146 RepID=UPI0030816F27
MKGHLIVSGFALTLIVAYLKLSSHGRCTYNAKRRSLLHSHPSREMRREIMERQKSLLFFYKTLLGLRYTSPEQEDVLRLLEEPEMDLQVPLDRSAPSGALTCQDLTHITGTDYIGSGFTKLVLKGTLLNGRAVALKSVHAEGNDMKRCLQLYGDHAGCHRLATYKLQKEIALLQILRSPGIIQLHGQCYEESPPSGVRVTAMLELGSPLEMIQLLQAPWEERFKICLELVQLLHYLATSPMGSIALLDFQPRQFVLVNGSLKVTDMDDATSDELACSSDADCALAFPARTFNVPCAVTGVCTGANEKRNLYNAYRFFFTYLLPHASPPALRPLLQEIMNATGDLHFGIHETLKAFEDVLEFYKSGMNQSQAPALRDYTVLKGFRMNDSSGDFRCWPSYHYQGCLLSVHSAAEAAEFCNSLPHCQSFVIGRQRTWTSRHLAAFTRNSAQLVPDDDSCVYVKRSGDEETLGVQDIQHG